MVKKSVCTALAVLFLFGSICVSAEKEYPTEKTSNRGPINIFTFLSAYDMFAEEMFFCSPHMPEPDMNFSYGDYAVYCNKNLDMTVKFLTGEDDDCRVRGVSIKVDGNLNFENQIKCAVCAIASYNGYDGSALSPSEFKQDVENWWYNIIRATPSDQYHLYGMDMFYSDGHLVIFIK